MSTKIPKEVLEAYLNCKFKGHLKLAGQSGSKSDLRDHAGHQEGEADEPEAVQEEQRTQGLGPRLVAQCWPEVSRRDNTPGHEAEGDTGSEES
jgi:hypothetical protein